MAASSPARPSALSRVLQRRSAATPGELRARLDASVAPIEGGFTLVSKLSGGGIVTRTLRTPDSDRLLFGRVGADRIRVALIPRGVDISPFQPIVGVGLESSGDGTAVTLELAPHPGARTFGGIFAFGALLLFIAAAVQFSGAPGVAALAASFALVLAVFPHVRARRGFQDGADRVTATLDELLELEAIA